MRHLNLIYWTFILLLFSGLQGHTLQAQSHVNGTLDDIADLSTLVPARLMMPDSVHLATDIYLPITSDSVVIEFELFGDTLNLEFIPKGIQLIQYDSVAGQPNPNPEQLPFIFTRTPYDKDELDVLGHAGNILGYGVAVQDMRGRYASEGVYFPMLSDAWEKVPYHPDFSHIADVTSLTDKHNSNFHEDGYNSLIQLLALERDFDLDYNDTIDSRDVITNGAIGMFGSSALGNTQLQAASVRPIVPGAPGLACLMPIVATNEHYNSTGYNNGVFRESLVKGWIAGQVNDLDDSLIPIDMDLQNDIHTALDYEQTSKWDVLDLFVDHFTIERYSDSVASAYPNSMMRADMDASFAPVDMSGIGAGDGSFDRYSNLDIPTYHVTGWWDIFINGQIETWQRSVQALQEAGKDISLQKLVIGPFAHQTIGSRTTGDLTYPENVVDFAGFEISTPDNFGDIDLNQFINSEILGWYRYNLNHNQGLGEPVMRLPESMKWQNAGSLGEIRVPSVDWKIKLNDFISFLGGGDDVPGIPVQLRDEDGNTFDFEIDLADIDVDLSSLDLGLSADLGEIPEIDFTTIPNIRFYVVGPVDDGIPANEEVGNFWYEADYFPLDADDGIQEIPIYLHENGTINGMPPQTDEGDLNYTHDPDNPVITIGGANMLVRTPDSRASQGQIDMSDPQYSPLTMNNDGVLQFNSGVLTDPITIAGIPEVTLYAASTPENTSPGDPTDTDFFVRILDVYPDGREFFVVEGAVNGRAREYAQSLAQGQEDIDAPFTNIESGKVYEYHFQLLPIAYAWGEGHRMKVLISSSNYNRYQVNPNLPIEDGDFFRREPNDGEKYNFNGQTLSPRIAEQSISFSPAFPTHLILPVLEDMTTSIVDMDESISAWSMAPNPANQEVLIKSNEGGETSLRVFDALGHLVNSVIFQDQVALNTSQWDNGIYFVEYVNKNLRGTHKLVIYRE